MINRTVVWTLICFFLFVRDIQSFRYDRDTERTLCRTQCAALCMDDKVKHMVVSHRKLEF